MLYETDCLNPFRLYGNHASWRLRKIRPTSEARIGMTELYHVAKDERVDCDSILVSVSGKNFLEIVSTVYHDRGGIEGQRPALKSKTAQTIRARLVDDLTAGAIVPPIVVGALVTREFRNRLTSSGNSQEVIALIKELGTSACFQ